ncbi:integrin alpha-M [Embiotoca jacksoni]|uniref:integrin alpha-M n=1 Tax=Embiotoca jacksoni TaxID=100190 RepID=UPI0037038306
MDWIVTVPLLLSVLKAAFCFNIDPVAWKSLGNPAAGFGYQVVQRQSDLLVSAPLEQYSKNGRGQIYHCTIENCQIMPVEVPAFAVNMSLGLTMKSDDGTQNTMVCGPTIPKDCKSITLYNGVCFQIDNANQFGLPVPSSAEGCPAQADIAFLLDGSGSVSSIDFQTMKSFVKKLVQTFLSKETQFSITQFSRSPDIHYFFDTFFTSGSWESNIHRIYQHGGATFTAKAINYVVQHVFDPNRGSRLNVKKVLIVITDGVSNDYANLPGAIRLAEQKNIVRFAIGVGSAFSDNKAKRELDTIASSPPEKHVFQVQSFDALEIIRQTLQDRIFSIEGSQTGGESLKMEMSQGGFNVAFVPGGIQMATVGANQWKGGYMQYSSTGQKVSSYEPENMKPDSYLGYSMAVAETPQGTLTVVGAPRYQHKGVVMAVYRVESTQMIEPFPWQTGEYFGAEVCAMDLNSDATTDLILISAPMYMDPDREGRVYVCRLIRLNVECHFDDPLVLRGAASENGRFGSSLAVLPDLNNDGLSDLAVGAPSEDDGQGSVYIFHGEGQRSISHTYSQRIAGSEVRSGLKYFGRSISPLSFDQSGDGLPDLAVGSKGTVVLLRSRPIVMVEATMSFQPNLIPTKNPDCSMPFENIASICFTMSRHSSVATAQARINYTLTLDATRKAPNNRAYIREKQREETKSVTIDLTRPWCFKAKFYVEACPDDAHNPLSNELKFTFDGLPSNKNLRPSLAEQAQTTTFHPLGFEINCGTDNKCVDDLNVDLNFTGSVEVRVGIDELLDVTVALKNREENSYNSRVVLTYPAGLSYRKFTMLQGRIECNSLDSEGGLSRGRTDCTVDKPIFKGGSEAFFIVSYGIKTDSELDSRIFVTANATSGNPEHSTASEHYKNKLIDVKYSIFMTIESVLSYSNFTFGKNNLQTPVQQSIRVTNDIRALNFTTVIKVPVKLGDKDIWVDSSLLQIPDCQRGKDEEPVVKDFVAQIQTSKIVNCSVARCKVFKCNRFMGRLESKMYNISANLSSGWIEQIGLQSAKFLLTSTASLEYDKHNYIFFSTGSNNNPPVHKVVAEVEVYPEPDFTTAIVGGSLGGLALLALLTAGLYKAGFFRSNLQQMITENADAASPGADGGAPTPE